MQRWRVGRGQRGASLVFVLVIVAVAGIVIPVLLTMADTGLRITSPVVKDRAETYAATSGIEAAIAAGRSDATIGAQGAECPDKLLGISGFEVTVTCEGTELPTDACRYTDRFVTFTASVRQPGESEVLFKSSADVAFRTASSGPPRVEVRQFVSQTDGPVTRLATPPCTDSPSTTTTVPPTTTTTIPVSTTTTTTTTTSTTTSTTTTSIPTPVLVASWADPATDRPPTTKKNTWRALASVVVKDSAKSVIKGASVSVQIRYHQKNEWHDEPEELMGVTDTSGVVRFQSEQYKSNGKKVDQVQFVVVGVSKAGYGWSSPTPETAITIDY